jgi:type II secretory pathway component PulM
MQLQGRDRQMLALAVGLVAAWLGWFSWVGPGLEQAARAQGQIERTERQLEELIKIRAKWDSLQAERAALEERLSRRGSAFSVSTALQGAAGRVGVAGNVKGTRETPAVKEGRHRRRAVEVELEGLTLDQLVSYLYEVEDPRNMLRVDRLEVRPQPDNPVYLNVSLAVSSVEAAAK